MRYIKTAIAVILLELMIGKIGYEYGCDNRIDDIGWLYGYAMYALIYIGICIYSGWSEMALWKNIVSTLYIFLPYMVLLILALTCGIAEEEFSFAVTIFVILGIALVSEIGALIIRIKEKVAKKHCLK